MSKKFESHLEGIDEDRRETVRTLVRLTAFAAPMIATFAIDGRMAQAVVSCNTTASGATNTWCKE